jgi:MarC family membrane protein
MLDDWIKFGIAFFVVVEPVSLVPAFATLTTGASDAFRRRMAVKSFVVATIICVLFAAGGAAFLEVMGISLEAFKIGGGVLLFLISLDMVFARESAPRHTTVKEEDEARGRQDISVFPLAFPLITGPGALAAILLAFSEPGLEPLGYLALLAAILVVLLITLGAMLLCGPLMRILGVTGSNVVSRLSGVVLAALAVQYILDGLRGALD